MSIFTPYGWVSLLRSQRVNPRLHRRQRPAPEAGTARGTAPGPALPDPPFRALSDGLALVAATAGPLALYLATMPRTVVLEDDGLFLMAGEHLGVAHPPGYPVFTWILHLFMQLPFGNPAFLGHLCSGLLGALACGAVFTCARLLGVSTLPALFAAWLFAASEHVWSQAIITEVYSFNLLLFFSVYGTLLYCARREGVPLKLLVAAAVAYGVGLANHWPLMVLAAPGLAVVLVPVWKPLLRKVPLLAVVAASTAALPYAWMVLRSQQAPAVSFYGPIRFLGAVTDHRSFLFYLARRGYSQVDTSASAGWADRWEYLQWFGTQVLSQLTLAGLVLAVVGLAVLLRRRRYAEACSGILVFLAHSVVLIVLLNFDFDYLYTSVFRPYSLVCYGLTALWLAVGAQFVLGSLRGIRAPAWRRAARACSPAVAGAGLAIAAWSLHAHWPVNNRSGTNVVQRRADLLFESLPPDAILVTYGDLELAPIGYFQYVEERRPDITLVDIQGLVYGNRLFSPFAPEERITKLLDEFVNATDRPVFLFDSDRLEAVCKSCGHRFHGYVIEAVRGRGGSGTIELRSAPEAENYFMELVDQDVHDAWEYRHRGVFLQYYGRYLGLLVGSGDPTAAKMAEPLLPYAERDFHSTIGMLETILPNWSPSVAPQAFALMERAEGLLREARLMKSEQGYFFYLKGLMELKRERREAAAAMFTKALQTHDHPTNPARERLRAIRAAPEQVQ